MALILRNGGSQSPDRWLREPRNNHAYRIIISAEDIQDTLKNLLSGTIQDMLETEMDNHLGYDRYERCGEPNYHSGTKPKTVRSKYGEF